MAANASCADCAPALGLPIAGGMAGQLVHSLLSLLWLLLGGSPCRVSPPPASGHHSAYPTHLFPTDVGFVGATRTGGVPYLRATDPVAGTTGIGAGTTTARVPQPLETEFPVADGAQPDFHPVDYWGNVKPYAPAAGGFGAKEFALPLTCTVQQAHYLHRHGARYPTSGSSFTPQVLYGALQEAIEAASFEGPLEFLNAWNYTQLGSDILTPVGNQQEFDSGVAAYYRHGGLLRKRADPQRRMVARTTSQSRMLSSAKYFLSGFFGLDFLAHVNLEVIVESEGFNNTLEPFYACPRSTSNSTRHSRVWIDKYMQPAAERLSSYSPHHAWTAYEAFLAQLMCPYETNALGYSAFCSLFTEDEWRGFAYASDLDFYRMSFGADFGPALGIGYVNELLRRVQGTPYDPHTQTSENATLDASETYFPLDQKLYFDFTHDTTITAVLAALNLKQFAGPMAVDSMPEDHAFRTSNIVPFGARLVTEIIECAGETGETTQYMHLVLNDRTVPLHASYEQCEVRDDGWCKLDRVLDALGDRNERVNWRGVCY